METKQAAAQLELEHPDRVTYEGVTVRAGARVFALLCQVIPKGAKITDVYRSVWGRTEVPENQLRTLCVRANKLLAELGYPKQLGVDRGRVVVY